MNPVLAGGRPLRAAIVGAGLMGKWHAHAVARCGHLVVAIIDSSVERATTVAQRHAGARAYASLRDVHDAIDVVHVCAPPASHVALVTEALARGAHVIAEKPLAPSAADTSELLTLAESAGRLLVPVHQFLFQRGVLEAAAWLPSIGHLLHFDAVACTAGAAGRSAEDRDRVALEVLPHALSLMIRLVSPDVAGAQWHVRRARAGELRIDGVLAHTAVSALVSTGGRPTTNVLRLIGENGTVHVDLFHGFAVRARGSPTRRGKVAQPFLTGASLIAGAASNLARRAAAREPAYPGLRELVRRFYDAVEQGTPAPISPAETLAVATALDRIAGAIATS